MIARDPRERWDYVLDCDCDIVVDPVTHAPISRTPRPDATIFHLRHLTFLQEQRLLNGLGVSRGNDLVRSDLGDAYTQTLRDGLDGWSKMRGKNGGFVEPQKVGGIVTDASFMCLTLGMRSELARAIENEIAVETVELGKSEQPSG